MRDKRKDPIFPLPFNRKPAPDKPIAQCRRADSEPVIRPVAFLVPPSMFIEIMRARLKTGGKPLGSIPEGHELN